MADIVEILFYVTCSLVIGFVTGTWLTSRSWRKVFDECNRNWYNHCMKLIEEKPEPTHPKTETNKSVN